MKDDTVEVLVRIPKRDFEELQSNYVWWGKHGEYIKKGIVLPKGHGRLIDADAVTKSLQVFKESFIVNTINGISTGVACLAPTILEADRGDENG